MKKFLPLAILLTGLGTAASAQDFEFQGNGDGTIDWGLNFTQSETYGSTQMATFTFNGGAGTNGDADAEGDIAATFGISGQTAGGNGYAVADTDLGTFAQSEFTSAAFSATGAIAGDLAFNGLSEVSVGGLVTAGGAGSAGTGLLMGSEYTFLQTGAGNLNFNYQAQGSSTP